MPDHRVTSSTTGFRQRRGHRGPGPQSRAWTPSPTPGAPCHDRPARGRHRAAAVAGTLALLTPRTNDNRAPDTAGRSPPSRQPELPTGRAGLSTDADSDDPSLAQPATLSTRNPGTLIVPPPTRRGASGVLTGFPHTPSGALGQLIAIDQAALQSVSIPAAQAIIGNWAAPGGPTADTWSGVAGLAVLLGAADAPADGTGNLIVTADPVHGTHQRQRRRRLRRPLRRLHRHRLPRPARTRRVAVADCQRMSWTGTRWVIGSGRGAGARHRPSGPAPAASFDAGYQWLEVAP